MVFTPDQDKFRIKLKQKYTPKQEKYIKMLSNSKFTHSQKKIIQNLHDIFVVQADNMLKAKEPVMVTISLAGVTEEIEKWFELEAEITMGANQTHNVPK